jgi:hypothetical protein
VAGAEEHVVARHDQRAVLGGSEVDELWASASAHPARVGHHVAVDAEPRDAAVGIDVEAQVREALVRVDLEVVLRAASERRVRAREDGRPAQIVREERGDRRVALDARALDRARRRVISGEERGVDHERAHDAGEPEADDRGVEIGMRPRRRVRVVAATT